MATQQRLGAEQQVAGVLAIGQLAFQVGECRVCGERRHGFIELGLRLGEIVREQRGFDARFPLLRKPIDGLLRLRVFGV